MKDEHIKKLLKESQVETSTHFTDILMEKIELERKVVTLPVWHKVLIIGCLVALIIISLVMKNGRGWGVPPFQIEFPPFFLQAIVILFVLYVVNFYLKMVETLIGLKKLSFSK